jgi:hypothetical protein
MIWENDRSKFGNPETACRGKQLCVNGRINSYKGVPEIIASDPTQVKAQVSKDRVDECRRQNGPSPTTCAKSGII